MKDYTSDSPVFSETIQIPETTDTNHADNINHAPLQIFENTLVNEKNIAELKEAALPQEYQSGSAYSVGDYILKDGVTYRVTEEITAGSGWDESKVTETNIYKDSGSGGTTDQAIAAEAEAREEADTSLNTDLQDLISIVNVSSAAAHNAIFRGKYLGDQVTDEQWTAIKAGTFDDLYIGDYWTINGFNWVIADFDYWWRCGDTGNAYMNHHIVIVPSTMLYYNTYMNSSSTTEGGYIGSYMYTTGLTEAKNMVISAFGSDHVVTHREYLTNAVTSGYPSGAEWVDSTVELMNEEMVYGCPIRQQMSHAGTAVTNTTIDKSQLALFRYDRTEFIAMGNGNNGGTSGTCYAWWLRDVVSATNFAYVSATGLASGGSASNTFGVRPCFGIY